MERKRAVGTAVSAVESSGVVFWRVVSTSLREMVGLQVVVIAVSGNRSIYLHSTYIGGGGGGGGGVGLVLV